jgi:hypothetical protein
MVAYYDTSSTWTNWACDTGTSTSSVNTAWITWTTTYASATSTTTAGDYTWVRWSAQEETKIETREQRRARDKAVAAAREMAELTAQELLKDLISEDEMEVYLKTGRVLVKGHKHDYILTKGYQADVVKVEKGKVIDLKNHKSKVKGVSYCVHPVDQNKIPDTDKVIAMKIALESEEESIMKRANARGDRELDLAVGM